MWAVRARGGEEGGLDRLAEEGVGIWVNGRDLDGGEDY